MEAKGRCHCGAISYSVSGEPDHHALCHCTDCRRNSGAPAVAWAMYPREAVTIEGTPRTYASSDQVTRYFCGECGTGLFYTNDSVFPGKIDVQSATLDHPDVLPLQAQIQTAERIGWMETLGDLPEFERYPEGPPEQA
jgi:hypothetical protein